MARRIIVGILWGAALYMIACVVTGAIIGFVVAAQADNAANVAADASAASRRIVLMLRPYFALAAILVSGLGIWKACLPGMVGKKRPS